METKKIGTVKKNVEGNNTGRETAGLDKLIEKGEVGKIIGDELSGRGESGRGTRGCYSSEREKRKR